MKKFCLPAWKTIKQSLSWSGLVAALMVLLTAYWLFVGGWGVGVRRDWQIVPNLTAWPWQAWLLPLGVLAVFGGAALLAAYDRFKRAKTDKERVASTRVCIVALMLTTFLWQWAMLGPGELQPAPRPGGAPKITLEGRFNIIAAMWSDLATEYFAMAYLVTDSRQFARDYVQVHQKPLSPLISHVATHPPGAVLFFYGVRRVVEGVPGLEEGSVSLASTLTRLSPQELFLTSSMLRESSSLSGGAAIPHRLPPSAIGTALVSALVLGLISVSIIPAVFWIAASGAGSAVERDSRGLLAAAFFALAPTLNLFSFTLDALVAGGVAWSLFCLARSMEGQRKAWLALSGLLLALTTFVSLGALAGIAICLGALLLAPSTRKPACLVWWVAGFGGTWLLILLIWPFSLPQSYALAMDAHRAATLMHRSWVPWIFMNVAVWSLFCGWPLIVALAARLKTLRLRNLHQDLPGWTPGELVGASGLACMLLLTVSGNVRGEVERLWLFLLAPAALLALSRVPWAKAMPLLLLQAVQTLIMAATLAPLVRPI